MNLLRISMALGFALLVAGAAHGESRSLPVTNPCAPAANPCAANPCAKNSWAARSNPCVTNPCGAPANPCAANVCAARSAEPISTIDALVGEFLAAHEASHGRPAGDEAVRFPGPEGRPSWFEALVVTRAENPLLEEGCKKQALQLSVRQLAQARGIADERRAVQAAAEHIRTHQRFVHSHGISYSEYLREIAECRAFCAPVVARLIQCQVLSVARRPHGIVLFALDSDAVDPRYERGVLANLATQLDKTAGSKVALIGRASRIGDLRYNRRLSARRALSVRDRLIALGVAPERVETMWFGWEPPQLSPWIADEYGLRALYDARGPLRMNQSVVAVVY